MQHRSRTHRPVAHRRRAAPAVLLSILGLVATPGVAIEVTSLYTTEVAFEKEAEDGRERAYAAALADVLGRVSGSALRNDPLMVETLFPEPAAYVLQFRPGARDSLWVSFDGRAIEEVLRAAGQPVWGSERPLTLVWLAVDWGQGRREIVAADDDMSSPEEARSIDRVGLLRERVLEAAARRGLPVVFPLLDTEDRSRVAFSDIWGGFADAVFAASARYEVDSILVGRLRSASSRQNRWSYHFGGEERSFSGSPEAVIDRVADLLASELAIGGDAELERVTLRIDGIHSIRDYGEVHRMLTKLSLIDGFRVTGVDGETFSYEVEAHGGSERLRRALRFGGLIEQDDFSADGPAGSVQAGVLQYFYSP